MLEAHAGARTGSRPAIATITSSCRKSRRNTSPGISSGSIRTYRPAD